MPGSRLTAWTSTSDGGAVERVRAAGSAAPYPPATNSRSATQSHSPGSPSNDRTTNAAPPPGAPWHALYRLPEPHGHG